MPYSGSPKSESPGAIAPVIWYLLNLLALPVIGFIVLLTIAMKSGDAHALRRAPRSEVQKHCSRRRPVTPLRMATRSLFLRHVPETTLRGKTKSTLGPASSMASPLNFFPSTITGTSTHFTQSSSALAAVEASHMRRSRRGFETVSIARPSAII